MESGNRNGYSQVGFIDDRDRSVGGNSGAPVEVLRRFHGGRRRTPTQQHHRAGHAVRGRLSGQCGRTRAFIPCSLLLSRVADDRRALRRILTDTHAHILGEEGRGWGAGEGFAVPPPLLPGCYCCHIILNSCFCCFERFPSFRTFDSTHRRLHTYFYIILSGNWTKINFFNYSFSRVLL